MTNQVTESVEDYETHAGGKTVPAQDKPNITEKTTGSASDAVVAGVRSVDLNKVANAQLAGSRKKRRYTSGFKDEISLQRQQATAMLLILDERMKMVQAEIEDVNITLAGIDAGERVVEDRL